MIFADRLRDARHAAGLDVATVARTTGLHPSSYYRLEQGTRQPSWTTVERLIAAGLGLEHFVDPEAIRAAAARLAESDDRSSEFYRDSC